MIDIEDFLSKEKNVTHKHIETLEKMLKELYNNFDSNKTQSECKKQITKYYHTLSNKYSKEYKIKIKKSDLVYVYSKMVKENKIVYDDKFQKCIQKKTKKWAIWCSSSYYYVSTQI